MEDTLVISCRPLAALELGFHTRRLRTLQDSAWAIRLTDIQNGDSALDSIHRCLVALSDRLNQLQFSLFIEEKNRIEERRLSATLAGPRVLLCKFS
jgi:hypothetical protein